MLLPEKLILEESSGTVMSKFQLKLILSSKPNYVSLSSYPSALALVASGKVNVKKLVTHHFDIKETAKAFETSRHGLGDAIKVIIHCQPRDANNKNKF